MNSEGYREILGNCNGAKEDRAGWSSFLRHLMDRGLSGVQLIISDDCRGLAESVGDFLPDARWQRCMVHFYHNVFSHVPSMKVREVTLETLTYYAFPDEHWQKIRTNNPLERIMREIRRRTPPWPKLSQSGRGQIETYRR